MATCERQVLIGVLTRLRDMEAQQRDDAISLLQVVRAFCEVRSENRAAYDNCRLAAERLISQRPFSDQGRQYDELIQRLKDEGV